MSSNNLAFLRNSLLLFCCFSLFFSAAQSQAPESYHNLVAEAEKAYEAGDYGASAQKYSEAFVSFGNKGYLTHRYNAGCSYALDQQIDSAFVQLFKIANAGNYMDYGQMLVDEDLESLRKDARWKELDDLVRTTKEKAEANLDKPLVALLESIYEEDQQYRMQIDSVIDHHGRDSEEMRNHWKIIIEHDSINLIQVVRILDERGWLGADVVGRKGNSCLFLVIQHSDQKTQEKYLPMMREAVKNGNARGSSFALLEDRVALGQGKKQIYGSQVGWDKEKEVYFVLPLEDPEHVDERRESMGLPPLQSYIENWGMNWDVEAYKKDLAEREAKK